MQIITDQNNIYHQTNNSNITKEYFQSAKFHMNVLEIQTTGFTMCKHNFNMNVFRHGARAALASPLEGPGYFIRQIPFVFRNTHLTNCTEHGHPCSPPDAFCIRATYRQAPPQIPPCLLEVFRMNPLLISSRSPIHTPQAKVQGSQQKAPCIPNSASRHRDRQDSVHDPSRYISISWCKMQKWPLLHNSFY